MRQYAMMLGVMLWSAHAQAAEVIQLADNNDQPRRFMSLASERDGSARARDKYNQPLARSDRGAMTGGFMRIDRARNAPIPIQHALVTPNITATTMKPAPQKSASAEDGPRVIREITAPDSEEAFGESAGADPVLSLFNDTGTGDLPSFHDALSGRRTGAIIAKRQNWPLAADVAQQISSDYGMRRDPIDGHAEFHGGIDISAAVGTPVLATAEATVMKVNEDPRYGKFVTLLHTDGIESHYGHLSSQNVREGQHVNPGQVIGAVGATGRTTGSHLDYRLSMNGAKIDPMTVLTPPAGIQTASNTKPTTPVTHTAARPAAKQMHEMQVKVVTVN